MKKTLLVMPLLALSLLTGCNKQVEEDGVNPPFELDNLEEKISGEEAIKFAEENFYPVDEDSPLVSPKSSKCEWDFTTTNEDHLEDVQKRIAGLLLMKEPDYSQIGFKGVLTCTNCTEIQPFTAEGVESLLNRGATFYLHNNTNLYYSLHDTIKSDEGAKQVVNKEGFIIYAYAIILDSSISGIVELALDW